METLGSEWFGRSTLDEKKSLRALWNYSDVFFSCQTRCHLWDSYVNLLMASLRGKQTAPKGMYVHTRDINSDSTQKPKINV